MTVEESDYKRVTELLLRLDFANLELASSSSSRWISEVRSGTCGNTSESWGQTVTGSRASEIKEQKSAAGVNTLNLGLVRKKRKAGMEEVIDSPAGSTTNESGPKVNVLGTGMIRKKAKV